MRAPRIPTELRYGPFTTAQAAQYGVTHSALMGPVWRNVFYGVWVHADVPDTRELRLAAVRLVLGQDAFICGLTAATVFGIDAQDRRAELAWIGCRTGARLRRRKGCLIRELTVDDSDLRVVGGVVVTTELRTAFDCGRWLELVEAVVVADAISHSGSITCDDLAGYVAGHRGVPGIRQAEHVVELMEPKTESPMETRIRLLMVFAGLPRPEPQFELNDEREVFVARVDFAWESERLVVEYDGSLHWRQRRADDRRRDALRDLGWKVLVFSAEDYYQHPATITAKVRSELAQRAA
jgi:hypothetical protein